MSDWRPGTTLAAFRKGAYESHAGTDQGEPPLGREHWLDRLDGYSHARYNGPAAAISALG